VAFFSILSLCACISFDMCIINLWLIIRYSKFNLWFSFSWDILQNIHQLVFFFFKKKLSLTFFLVFNELDLRDDKQFFIDHPGAVPITTAQVKLLTDCVFSLILSIYMNCCFSIFLSKSFLSLNYWCCCLWIFKRERSWGSWLVHLPTLNAVRKHSRYEYFTKTFSSALKAFWAYKFSC